MTNEQKLEIIRDCINDIEVYLQNENIPESQKRDVERAMSTYNSLYKDAALGKLDIDTLHENISSYLYVLQ